MKSVGEEVVPLGPLMEVEVEGAAPLPLVWESLIAIVCYKFPRGGEGWVGFGVYSKRIVVERIRDVRVERPVCGIFLLYFES